MRGARIKRANHQHGLGIIPADAGSTGQSLVTSLVDEDHPRGCGEHITT